MANSIEGRRKPLNELLADVRPPRKLPKHLVSEWWEYVDSDVGRLLLLADMPMVEFYFRQRHYLERLEKRAEDMWEDLFPARGDGSSSRHGILMEINRVSTLVLSLAKELGMSPSSRTKMRKDMAEGELTLRKAFELRPVDAGGGSQMAELIVQAGGSE